MSDHLIAEANRHAKALPVNPDRLALALALQTIDELERENAALRADKERLDSRTILLTENGERVHHVEVNLRAAIDAAREAQP